MEDKIVGWHHQLDGHEFEKALGDGEGQGSLEYYSPWVTELDMTERLNNNKYTSTRFKSHTLLAFNTF